jgi:hypothetical protein
VRVLKYFLRSGKEGAGKEGWRRLRGVKQCTIGQRENRGEREEFAVLFGVAKTVARC